MNVFITGASSGIGAALANEFAKRGARLGLVARRRDALDRVAAALPGKHHTYMCVDVTDKDALIGAAREFDAAVGGTDIVIANAGISVGVKTEFYEDLEQFARVFDTNVIGMATTFHPFIAGMKARRSWDAGRHRERGRCARTAGIRCVLRFKSRRDRLLRKPAGRDGEIRHQGRHDLARLHSHFDDKEKSVSDAFSDGRRCVRAARGRRDRRRRALPHDPVADGLGDRVAES